MKPGLRTSEFAISVAIVVCATVAMLAGKIDADRWLFLLTGVATSYSLSRGIAKHGSDVNLHADTSDSETTR